MHHMLLNIRCSTVCFYHVTHVFRMNLFNYLNIKKLLVPV